MNKGIIVMIFSKKVCVYIYMCVCVYALHRTFCIITVLGMFQASHIQTPLVTVDLVSRTCPAICRASVLPDLPTKNSPAVSFTAEGFKACCRPCLSTSSLMSPTFTLFRWSVLLANRGLHKKNGTAVEHLLKLRLEMFATLWELLSILWLSDSWVKPRHGPSEIWSSFRHDECMASWPTFN